MRVLQIHNRYRERGGEDRVVAAERALLEGDGHEVVRFERSNPEAMTATAASMLAAPWNPLTAAQVRRLVRSRQPSVAHVHNTWFAISPSAISALHREAVPTVMTVHNYRLACVNGQLLRQGKPCQVCVGTHPWSGVRYRCYRNSAPASVVAAATLSLNRRLGTWQEKVARYLVLTEFMRRILERTGIAPDRTALVPNFVNDPGPRTSPPSQSDTILFVGRLAPEKGIGGLIDAWEGSAPRGVRLMVVGDGPMRPMLENRPVPGVILAGNVSADEVRDLMLSSRALAFPSTWYEGQPMVILEALAAGLPVFASDLGGSAETVGGGGVMVDSWPAFAFDRLSDSLLDEVGLAGRREWQSRFTPQRHLRALLDAYEAATY